MIPLRIYVPVFSGMQHDARLLRRMLVQWRKFMRAQTAPIHRLEYDVSSDEDRD